MLSIAGFLAFLVALITHMLSCLSISLSACLLLAIFPAYLVAPIVAISLLGL